MVADNIDNLERTLRGSGMSHRVNCILVTERSEGESGDESDDQDYIRTTSGEEMQEILASDCGN